MNSWLMKHFIFYIWVMQMFLIHFFYFISASDDNSRSSLESKIHYDMESKEARSVQRPDTYVLFKKFCELGLSRLSLRHLQDIDMLEIWREAQPFTVCQFNALLLRYIFICLKFIMSLFWFDAATLFPW